MDFRVTVVAQTRGSAALETARQLFVKIEAPSRANLQLDRAVSRVIKSDVLDG
ncbi:hypothetical protein A1F97_01518 [Pyrenophora tritici-repentis]|uniref:Uncharacterized protein n=1 Tax=Pyrenophora tritici-repentis TaxID=45151 RepID=A0A2W1H8F4_9PLEO|nr:hypothetical protein Ptr86124_012476 [Pyrenophora tritici-repentis]KAI1681180.1 hypothetical protein KJE20_10031 [Pyrenophora tritici-repentis]PZD45313.1 hypothetical protein A1F97_01518 [Pyrenophora tritici-repentis]